MNTAYENRTEPMVLVFRKLPPPEELEPQAGELYLVPADPERRQPKELAKLVLEKGPEGLVRGPGTPQVLVIDADPKLDDMLAASLVQRQLAGRTLPFGCSAFGHYAARLREVLRPTSFPLENSLEGLFLAIRGHAEEPLTDPETGRQFLADWARLADLIFQAAEQGKDPFSNPPFERIAGTFIPFRSINRKVSKNPLVLGFARERAFLAKDLDISFRGKPRDV